MTYTLIRTKLQVWDQVLDEPVKGTVIVTPSITPIKDNAGNRLLSAPNVVHLDADGWFEADLPASDDPGLTPTAFGYTFDIRAKGFSYEFTTQVRLADATEVTETGPDGTEYTHWELDLTGLAPVLPDIPISQAEALRNEMLTLRAQSSTDATEADASATAASSSAAQASDYAAEALGHANDAEAFAAEASAGTAEQMAVQADLDGSAFRTALTRSGKKPVGRGELVVNVMDHGAVGDGIANDTAAWTAAMAAAGPGGRVYAPPLVYAINTTLTINSVTIDAPFATLKKTGNSVGTFITIPAGAVGTKVRGVKIDCNNLVTGAVINHAPGGVTDTTFEYCTITNTLATNAIAFRVRDGVSKLLVRHCTIDGVTTGVYTDGNASDITIEHTRIKNWAQRGIYTVGSATLAPSDVTLRHNHVTDMVPATVVSTNPTVFSATVRQPIVFESNTANPIRRVKVNYNNVIGPDKAWTHATDPGTADQISLHDCVDFEVIGNFSKGGGDGGMAIGGYSSRGVVSNNICIDADVAGIFLGSSSSPLNSTTITDNVFMNNGQARNGDRNDAGRAGIRGFAASDCLISGNTLGDDQSTKTQKYGTSLTGCSDIEFGTNIDCGNGLGLFYDDGGNTNIRGARGKVSRGELAHNILDFAKSVGGGVINDQQAYNAALAAATSPLTASRTILFPDVPGGYRVFSLGTAPGVRLLGENKVTIKTNGAPGHVINTVNCDGFGVENLTIDGNSTATTTGIRIASANVTIRDCVVKNVIATSSAGISIVAGASNVKILDCIVDNVQMGIHSSQSGATGVQIRRNWIKNWRTRGIRFYESSTGVNATAASRIRVCDNDVTDCIHPAVTDTETQVDGPVPIAFNSDGDRPYYNVHVNRNTVIGRDTSHENLDPPGTADQITCHFLYNFEVNGNISVNGGEAGISVTLRCVGGVVNGNTVKGSDGTGMHIWGKGISATGNTVIDPAQNRSGLKSSSSYNAFACSGAEDVLFSGNMVLITEGGGSNCANAFNCDTQVANSNIKIGDDNSFPKGLAIRNANGAITRFPDMPAVVKLATEVRSNQAASADLDLTEYVDANAGYRLEMVLMYAASSTADFRASWDEPTGAVLTWSAGGMASNVSNSAAVDQHSFVVNANLGGIDPSTMLYAKPVGNLTTDEAGYLTFEWGQFAPEVSDVSLFVGSYLKLYRYV